jgi:DNA-binding transcriptional ArsR family regulator
MSKASSLKSARDLSRLQKHAGEAAALLKALANENRLMILCTLMGGEMSVGELNERIPLSQSALSQHLAGLREAGLVKTRKEAQSVFYQLDGDEATRVIAVLQSIYCPDI